MNWEEKGLYDLSMVYQRILAYGLNDENPSEEDEVYWLFAHRKKGKYPKSTRGSGKWLVFVNVNEVDEVWKKIKKATEKGKLGGSSKVSTMKRSSLSRDPNVKVVCVYTYNWKDREDVMKIREELRKIGIVDRIPYKTNTDTIRGKYSNDGDKRISKYFE